MKALVLSNGELQVKEIDNTLEELQKIVGGHIEIPFLGMVFKENKIDVVINEDGKYVEGLKPEIAIVNEKQGNILDVIYGNCVFVSHNEKGDTIALTDEQINVVMEELETVIELTNKNTFESFEVRALFI